MKKYGTFILLSLLAACTQPPAQVVDKSGMFFGRGGDHQMAGTNNYSTESYGFQPARNEVSYSTPASNTSVAVNDLPPPTANAQPAYHEPAVQTRELSSNNSSPFRKPLSEITVADSETTYHTSDNLVRASSDSVSSVRSSAHASASRFIWPVEGKVISRFGNGNGGKYNDGINIASEEGEPVWAAADGQVAYAGNELKGYGNMVLIRHDDGWITAYAHAKKLDVKQGQYVKQGDIIAYVGDSGGVKNPQLHFAIRKGKDPVDPEKYLTHEMASLH